MDLGLAQFAQDAQQVRNALVLLDTLSVNARYAEHARASKGLAVVWISAILERFWKVYLVELCARVSGAGVKKRRTHLSATSIFYFDNLGSMGEGKAIRRWERASDLFAGLPALAGASATPAIPYDGRTIRPEHIELAWRVFALPNSRFPSPIHRQELITLADRRNDVAHGHLLPQVVGGGLTILDLNTSLKRVEDIVQNCVLSASQQW